MSTYRVNREFYTDTARFEPGESDLAGLSEAEKADVVANGWVTPLGDAPAPTPEPLEEAPLALTHWAGEGPPPPGTWEHYWQQEAASDAASTEPSPRKRRKNEE